MYVTQESCTQVIYTQSFVVVFQFSLAFWSPFTFIRRMLKSSVNILLKISFYIAESYSFGTTCVPFLRLYSPSISASVMLVGCLHPGCQRAQLILMSAVSRTSPAPQTPLCSASTLWARSTAAPALQVRPLSPAEPYHT